MRQGRDDQQQQEQQQAPILTRTCAVLGAVRREADRQHVSARYVRLFAQGGQLAGGLHQLLATVDHVHVVVVRFGVQRGERCGDDVAGGRRDDVRAVGVIDVLTAAVRDGARAASGDGRGRGGLLVRRRGTFALAQGGRRRRRRRRPRGLHRRLDAAHNDERQELAPHVAGRRRARPPVPSASFRRPVLRRAPRANSRRGAQHDGLPAPCVPLQHGGASHVVGGAGFASAADHNHSRSASQQVRLERRPRHSRWRLLLRTVDGPRRCRWRLEGGVPKMSSSAGSLVLFLPRI